MRTAKPRRRVGTRTGSGLPWRPVWRDAGEDTAMNELIELKGKINRVFDDLMSRFDQTEGSVSTGEWIPRVDLYELPDRVVLRADIPGVRPEDLDVRIEGGHLIMRGNRQQPEDIDASALCRLERPFGTFARRYALPDAIDPEKVRATCRDGVLEMVIGKREETAVRRIPVRND